jgi:hypothetical protein
VCLLTDAIGYRFILARAAGDVQHVPPIFVQVGRQTSATHRRRATFARSAASRTSPMVPIVTHASRQIARPRRRRPHHLRRRHPRRTSATHPRRVMFAKNAASRTSPMVPIVTHASIRNARHCRCGLRSGNKGTCWRHTSDSSGWRGRGECAVPDGSARPLLILATTRAWVSACVHSYHRGQGAAV